MSAIFEAIARCARDWRWHRYCDQCARCRGHGTVIGLAETPPQGPWFCLCGNETTIIDTESGGNHDRRLSSTPSQGVTMIASKPGRKATGGGGQRKVNYGTRLSPDVVEFLRENHWGDASRWIEALIRKRMEKK